MISLNQLKSQLTEGLSYGSDRLYVIEVEKNNYWETYQEKGYGGNKTCFAYIQRSMAKSLAEDLQHSSLNAQRYRVVTYAPVGAS